MVNFYNPRSYKYSVASIIKKFKSRQRLSILLLFAFIFSQQVNAQYCAGSGSGVNAYGIEGVYFNTINQNSNSNDAYTNYTSVSTTVIKGSTFTLNVDANTRERTGNWLFGYTYYRVYGKVWIDWNQNGTFEIAERYDLGNRNTDGNLNINITIPTTALTGATRMRVRVIDENNNNACDNGANGEVEDYTIIVADQNATITNVTPSPVCIGSTVTITGTNLSGVTVVRFYNNISATFTIVSSTSITSTVPTGATSGPITLTAPNNSPTSSAITINAVPGPITINGGAASINFCSANTIINATGGSGGTIHYQGTNSNGTTQNSFSTATISATGTYYFRSFNGTCWGPSKGIIVNKLPAVGAVSVSGAGSFCESTTITATGGTGGTIYFQGTTSNGTSIAQPINTATITTSGTYYFRAYNECGWGTQGSVAVTINPLPATVTVNSSIPCGTATLTAIGGAGGTIYFQDVNSSGTSTALGGSTAVVNATGTYYFRSRSSFGCWGPVGSVSVIIAASVGISSHPNDVTTCIGSTATFSVGTTGTPTSYQWRRGTTNLTNGAGISGATTNTLTLNPVTAGMAAPDYNCLITDNCGSVTTNFAELIVNPTVLAPTQQAIGLSFLTGTNSVVGSFTPSATATGYLVIRTSTAIAPINPADGTNYTAGTTALGGVVVSSNGSNSFIATGLAQNTNYWFWVFAYNDGSCGTSPNYLAPTTLSGTVKTGTTTACGTLGNLYWAGAGSTFYSTGSTNLNLASNWSTSASSYNPSLILPTECTNVFINVFYTNIFFIADDDPKLNLTTNLKVHNLNYTVYDGYFDFIFLSFSTATESYINTNDFKLEIFGNSTINTSGSRTNRAIIGEINPSSAGVVDFKADVNIGGANNNYASSEFYGNVNSKIIFRGSLNLGPTAYIENAPGTTIFNAKGGQQISWKNNYPVEFNNIFIGELATDIVTVLHDNASNSYVPNNFTGNLTMNGVSTLDLTNRQWNRATTGGTMTMNHNSKLLVGQNSSTQVFGSGVTVAGSNFPGGFSTHNFVGLSTIEYNGKNNINQTVFNTPVYQNLVLTNGSNSGVAINKNLSANTSVKGNLTLNPFAVLNQNSFTLNRTASGGSLALLNNSEIKLSGTSGGAGANNNFPNNFSTKNLAPTSTINYYGGNQGIYGGATYGHLELGGTGSKTAPTVLNINGNFTKSTNTVYLHNSGLVNFTGATEQIFSAALPKMEFRDITNSNPVNLTINSDLGLENKFLMDNSSKLNLKALFSLRSTLTNTAFVAEIPNGATISYSGGNFGIERYIKYYQSWNLLSAPIKSTQSLYDSWQEGGAAKTSNGFGTQITGVGPIAGTGLDAISVSNSFKYYNAQSGNYEMVGNTTTQPVNNTEGFFAYVRGDRGYGPGAAGSETTLRSKGVIYDAESKPLFNFTSPANSFIQIGNPYASAVDLAKFFNNNINLEAAIYFWDPSMRGPNSAYNVGGYQTLTQVTGWKLTPGLTSIYSIGTSYPSIQSGQAAFVYTTVEDPSITFKENMKADGSRLVSRGNNSNEGGPIEMLSTMIYNSSGIVLDGNRVVFSNNYSNEVDNYDAKKITNSGVNFGLLRNQKKLAVEARQPISVTDTLFYNISNLSTGSFNLGFSVQNIPAGNQAFLIDKFLQTRTPVSLTDSSFYSFAMTADAASKASDRFMMVFKPAAGPLPVTITGISANRNKDRSIGIRWTVENEVNIEKYEIERSSDGRNFTGIISAASTNSSVYTKNDLSPLATDNFYRIKALTVGGYTQYSSIVKVAQLNELAAITVSPNPVVDQRTQVRFINQTAGTYELKLFNQSGQLMQKEQVKVVDINFVKTFVLNNNFAAGVYQLSILKPDGSISSQQLIIK